MTIQKPSREYLKKTWPLELLMYNLCYYQNCSSGLPSPASRHCSHFREMGDEEVGPWSQINRVSVTILQGPARSSAVE